MSKGARLSSRRLYTGRVLNLDLDTVAFPDGSVGELEIIRHSGASAVLPLLDGPSASDVRAVLIRQYRYAAGGFVYEVPAGRLGQGESPEACAHRELEEETGYKAARIAPMTSIFTTPGFTDERIHLFLAWDLTLGRQRHERDEFLSVATLPLQSALQLVENGGITDAKTIVALLYAASFGRAR